MRAGVDERVFGVGGLLTDWFWGVVGGCWILSLFFLESGYDSNIVAEYVVHSRGRVLCLEPAGSWFLNWF